MLLHRDVASSSRLRALLAPALVHWIAACGGVEGDRCESPAPATPQTLSTTSEFLHDESSSGLVADASGVYWYNSRGAVYARPHGESELIELRPGLDPLLANEEPRNAVIGIAADAEHIYVGDATYMSVELSDVYPRTEYAPPGRLMAYPKGGGEPSLVLELGIATITPLTADDRRIVISIDNGISADLSQIDKESGLLTYFLRADPPEDALLLGEAFYWMERVGSVSNVMRNGFDENIPEIVTTIDGSDFSVGPGYVLSREPPHGDPAYDPDPNFIAYDEASGCTRTLSTAGANVSFPTVGDEHHAYWLSYDVVTDSTLSQNAKLMRIDVSDGSLAQIDVDEFDFTRRPSIVGYDGEYLYIDDDRGLFAVRVP